MLAEVHGPSIMRAILSGFAGNAPRTASPNLIELLSVLVTRYPVESRRWMLDVLHAVSTVTSSFFRSGDFDTSLATGGFRRLPCYQRRERAICQDRVWVSLFG